MTAAPHRAAALFAALGDETRLRVLLRLVQQGPASIAGLSTDADVTRQAVTKHLRVLARAGTKHLRVLARAGLVSGRRHGREHLWRCRPAGLTEAQRYLARVAEQWDGALARLKDLVEA